MPQRFKGRLQDPTLTGISLGSPCAVSSWTASYLEVQVQAPILILWRPTSQCQLLGSTGLTTCVQSQNVHPSKSTNQRVPEAKPSRELKNQARGWTDACLLCSRWHLQHHHLQEMGTITPGFQDLPGSARAGRHHGVASDALVLGTKELPVLACASTNKVRDIQTHGCMVSSEAAARRQEVQHHAPSLGATCCHARVVPHLWQFACATASSWHLVLYVCCSLNG